MTKLDEIERMHGKLKKPVAPYRGEAIGARSRPGPAKGAYAESRLVPPARHSGVVTARGGLRSIFGR